MQIRFSRILKTVTDYTGPSIVGERPYCVKMMFKKQLYVNLAHVGSEVSILIVGSLDMNIRRTGRNDL